MFVKKNQNKKIVVINFSILLPVKTLSNKNRSSNLVQILCCYQLLLVVLSHFSIALVVRLCWESLCILQKNISNIMLQHYLELAKIQLPIIICYTLKTLYYITIQDPLLTKSTMIQNVKLFSALVLDTGQFYIKGIKCCKTCINLPF